MSKKKSLGPFISKNISDTHKNAALLAKQIKKFPALILLTGDLGSGKTEWVRGFVKAYLKSKVTVTSPTYSLMNLYGTRKKAVYHVDLYRLKNSDDLESTGFWDFIQGRNIILVEWGDMLLPHWPKDLNVITLQFKTVSETKREISQSSAVS